MSDGLAGRADLLAAILPRVAAEPHVVAIAAERLLTHLDETIGWRLYLEHRLPPKKTRCDVIVQRPAGEHPRATYFASSPFRIARLGTVADAQVVAWSARPAEPVVSSGPQQ